MIEPQGLTRTDRIVEVEGVIDRVVEDDRKEFAHWKLEIKIKVNEWALRTAVKETLAQFKKR